MGVTDRTVNINCPNWGNTDTIIYLFDGLREDFLDIFIVLNESSVDDNIL